MRIIIWSIIFVLSISFCRAQLNASTLEDFTQTTLSPYLINPSTTDTSYHFKISANNLDEIGFIKNVRKFYFDLDKKIKSSRANTFHFVGLQALNSKLGDYISRNSLQLRYSWLAPVSSKANISAGISLGFINYAFLTSHGGAGGSDYTLDGMAGIHYLRPNTQVGVSIQHLFPGVLTPINQSFSLSRVYSLDVSRKFQLMPKINLMTYAVMQHYDQEIFLYSLGLMSEISGIVLIGVNNFNFSKTSINLGLKRIRFMGVQFWMVMTYSIYHNNFPMPDNTFEQFIAVQK